MLKLIHSRRHRSVRRFLFSFLLLLPLSVFVFFRLTSTASARWWDEGWSYRQKVTFTNSGSELTDFQVAITVNTSTLISADKMRPDCADIRITDTSDALITEPYWVESCNASVTKIWMKLSSVPAGTSTFFLYYGNNNASSQASAGENVFIFFDDFLGTSLSSNWTNSFSPGYYTLTNGELAVWSSGSTWKGLNLSASAYDSSPTDLHYVETKHRITNTENVDNNLHVFLEETNNRFGIHPRYSGTSGPRITYRVSGGGYNNGSVYGTTTANNYYIHQIVREAAGTFRARTYDTSYSLIGTATQTQAGWNAITFTYNVSEYQTTPGIFDWVRVRQYSSTEPSSSNASEETSPRPLTAYWKFDEGFSQSQDLPLTRNEQEIPILDKYYNMGYNANMAYVPTDNSLGLIRWDGAKYSDETVYFEAIFRGTGNGGSPNFFAALYTSDGVQVGGSVVRLFAVQSWTLVRSNPIVLQDGVDYTVRVTTSGGTYGYWTEIKAARIIVTQSSEKITATQTQIDIGANETSTSGTYAQLTNKKIYYYDSSKFSPSPSAYFEASISNDTADQTAYAALYENGSDCTTQVSGSEVSTTGTTWTRVRSNSITLTTATEYMVCIKAGANTARIANAKIILDQSYSAGISAVETVKPLVNYVLTYTTTYADQDAWDYYYPSLNHYAPYNNGTAVFFEATIKTSSGTGLARLKNDTDGSAVTGSELSTTGTAYSRQISGNIASALPLSTKTMDTQIQGSSTTTSVSSSWLVIQNTNIISAITHDYAPNLFHGNLNNSPTWESQADCKYDKCLQFDGVNDFVAVADNPKLDFAASDTFTISLWFKSPQATGSGTLLSKFNNSSGTDGGYKIVMESDGDLTFGIDDDSTWGPDDYVTSTAATYDDGAWHHLTAVKNGTSGIYLYIDGLRVGYDTSIAATGTLANTDGLFFGVDGNGTNTPFKGYLDEIKIYPSAWTEADVKAGVTRGTATFGSGDTSSLTDNLATYWKFNESSANTCDDTNDSCDSSGNNNHARWEGNTTPTAGKYGNAIDLDGNSDHAATTSANFVPDTVWYNSSWKNRIRITVNNSASTEDLTDFPLLVKLDSSRINYTQTKDLGQDVRFVDSDNSSPLAYEIEKWDETGSSFVWVKIPTIPANSINTYFWLYYNNPSADDNQSPNSVWNTNYVGVWHLNETSGTNINDSSTTNNDGTKTSESSPDPSTGGKVDGSLSYDGANNAVSIPDNAVYDLGNTMTLETWVNPPSCSGRQTILGRGGQAGVVQMEFNNSSCAIGTIIEGTYVSYTGTAALTAGQLNYVVYTRNGAGATHAFYINGQPVSLSTNATNSYTNPAGAFEIGRRSAAGSQLLTSGVIVDEFRISNIPRSAEWNEAQYLSMTDSYLQFEKTEEQVPKPFTLSAWVYPDTVDSNQRILVSRGSSPSFDWAIALSATSSGKIWYTSDGETNKGTSNKTISTGTWSHVAMVTEGLKTKLYINGEYDGDIPNNGNLPGSGNISIGAAANGTQGFDGKIDEVRIYARALSAGDINQLYNWSSGPIIYYPLDENSGQSANDISGNQNPATLGASSSVDIDDPAWITGKFGSALQFDGSNDYAQAGSNPITGTSAFTLEGWLKAGSHSNYGLAAAIGNGTTSQSAYIGWVQTAQSGTSNSLGGGFYGTNYGSGITDNNWHFVTLTFGGGTGGTAILYVDGVAKVNTTYTPALASTAISLGKANTGTSYWYNGLVDDVKIYNYARTPGQIIEDMNAGHPAPGSPVGSSYVHYEFDEGYGSSAHNSGNGGSSLNGTITSGTWTNSGKFGKALTLTASSSVTATITDPGYINSVSLWVYPTTSAASKILVTTNKLTTDSSSRPVYGGCTGTALPLSTWTHILAVSNGSGSCVIYQNGTLAAINTSGVTFGPSIDIGGSSFTGNVDDFQFFNSTLTADQAKMLYNQGVSTVFGSLGTTSAGAASFSDDRGYCPPGDTTASCSPIAEWKMDEGSWNATSGEVKDTSGNGNHGTATSNTTTGTGKFGNAGKTSYDQYVSLGTPSTLDMTTNDFTIDGWVKISNNESADDWQSIIHKGADTTTTAGYWFFFSESNNYMRLGISNGSSRFNCPGTVASTQTTTVDDGNWHHVEGVVDRTNNRIKIYIDGKLEQNCDSSSLTGSLTNPTEEAFIAEYAGTGGTSGTYLADNIRIYNYDRSESQIAWDYNLGAPQVWYKFDECYNPTLNNHAPAASGGDSGNDATIYPVSNGNTSVGSCNGTDNQMWYHGASGKFNSSLDFDGDDDYTATSNTALIAVNSVVYPGLSWGGWFRPATSPASDTLIHKNNEFRLTTDSGGYPQCEIYYSSTWTGHLVKAAAALPTSSWTHVLCIYDGSGLKIYINGAQSGYLNQTTGITSSSSTALSLARDSAGSGYFDGQIDDVKIWSYPLTSQQALVEYNGGALRFAPQ